MLLLHLGFTLRMRLKKNRAGELFMNLKTGQVGQA